MDKDYKEKIRYIINYVNNEGLKWKQDKDIKHLETRKKYGHISKDCTLEEYEEIIMNIINNKDKENDVFIFGFKRFDKLYFTFASRQSNWIVIIGEDALMETAYHIDKNYDEHLSLKNGYTYIGKLKEVIENE